LASVCRAPTRRAFPSGLAHCLWTEAAAVGGPIRVKGYCTYNHGKPGWVEAELVNGHLSCLHYWDRVDCRQLGQGLGKQLEAAAAEAERNERLHPTQRTAPSESQEPSALECHMYSSAPMIAGMAGCPPWTW
jgi:hypothetical protein